MSGNLYLQLNTQSLFAVPDRGYMLTGPISSAVALLAMYSGAADGTTFDCRFSVYRSRFLKGMLGS